MAQEPLQRFAPSLAEHTTNDSRPLSAIERFAGYRALGRQVAKEVIFRITRLQDILDMDGGHRRLVEHVRESVVEAEGNSDENFVQ